MSPGAQSAFAEKLKQLIAQRGVTQTELASRTGIDRVELNRMVNDKREPKAHEVALLAVALKAKPEELAGDVNRDEVKVFTLIAERLLSAEDGLTERVLELQAVVEAQRAAEIRWAAERQELVEEVALARQQASARVAEVEAAAAGRERDQNLLLREQRERVAQQAVEIGQLRNTLAANATTIQELRAALAGEGGRALIAGVIGALAGVALAKAGD